MDKLGLSELGRRTEAPPISWLMGTALARPNLISLAAGFTDNESLPVQEARVLLEEILGSRATGEVALQYGSTAGDPLLRELTATRLKLQDAQAGSPPAYAPERMIVTNGSQQMLYMLSEALCDPGDIILVEDPTYFVYLGIVQSHGLCARGVRLQRDGLDLAHLEEVLQSLAHSGELRRVKLLYLVSYYQNPTGVTTSFEKKRRILELLERYEPAAGHPLYLLEDAAYRELRFRGPDEKSALAAAAHGERVLYLGTYSKPFATGTRVGYGLLPEPVYTAVFRIKGNHDFGSSSLLLQLLARALASGRYEQHLEQLRNRYARKAGVMLQALQEVFPPTVRWWEPAGGLYFWVRLPEGHACGPESKLFQTALAHDVLYVPGELCYAEDPTRPKPNHEMRLSFGAETEDNIRAGMERLGAVLRGGE